MTRFRFYEPPPGRDPDTWDEYEAVERDAESQPLLASCWPLAVQCRNDCGRMAAANKGPHPGVCVPCAKEEESWEECQTCGEPVNPEHPRGEPHCWGQEHDSRNMER